MHAFGLNRDLCCEFLKKQCRVLNITKGKCFSTTKLIVDNKFNTIITDIEQEKLLHDNVTRLYRETDPWREQVHQKLTAKK